MNKVKHSHPGRQYDSFELCAENGREKESRTNVDLKQIWDFLLVQRIRIKTEHLQGNLNFNAGWESPLQ